MGIRLVGINYGDVNSDKIEDAIIVFSFQTGGSALPNSVYVYTCYSNKKPILLWAFSTDDRADGGLRDVYIQKDGIVVERYSPIDKEGDCCPVFFTRAFYSWKGNGFKITSKEELLPNTEKAATLHFRSDRLPKP